MGLHIGNYLQELRHGRGISLRQLAKQVDRSPGHLSMIEHGQREPTIGTLYPVIKFLGGDFRDALQLLALDAGVSENELP